MLVELKIALLQHGISQIEIAHAIGRTPAHISRLMHGHAKAHARDRRRIAEFLGISEVKLFPVGRKRRNETKRSRTATKEILKRKEENYEQR